MTCCHCMQVNPTNSSRYQIFRVVGIDQTADSSVYVVVASDVLQAACTAAA